MLRNIAVVLALGLICGSFVAGDLDDMDTTSVEDTQNSTETESTTKDEQMEGGTNFCDMDRPFHCYCALTEDKILVIDCSSSKLKSLLERHDWYMTLTSNQLQLNETKIIFDYNDNLLSEVSTFPSLPIVELDLNSNRITKLDRHCFRNLKSLKHLDLSNNGLISENLNEGAFFGDYSEDGYFPLPLQSLNLSHNSIHTIPRGMFQHLTSLESLDLSNNPLSTLNPSSQEINRLLKLRYLNLAGTGIKDIPEGMLHSLKNLESLDLSNNKFSKIPEEIRNSHQLRHLILSGNEFDSLDSESFQGLEELITLEICDVPTLYSIGYATFGPLHRLDKLKLCNNARLTNLSEGAFAQMAQSRDEWTLQELDISNNGIPYFDEALLEWHRVDKLNIQGNAFKCDCKIEWMTVSLIKNRLLTSPDDFVNLQCYYPEAMSGKSLLDMLSDSDFKHCDEYSIFNPELKNSIFSSRMGIIVLIIGTMASLALAGLTVLILVRKHATAQALRESPRIRYERAQSDDMATAYYK